MFKVGDKVRVKNYSEFEKDFLKVENSYTVFYHTIKSVSINKDMIAITLGKTLVIKEIIEEFRVDGYNVELEFLDKKSVPWLWHTSFLKKISPDQLELFWKDNGMKKQYKENIKTIVFITITVVALGFFGFSFIRKEMKTESVQKIEQTSETKSMSAKKPASKEEIKEWFDLFYYMSEKVITLGVAGVGAYLSVKQISKKRAWQNA